MIRMKNGVEAKRENNSEVHAGSGWAILLTSDWLWSPPNAIVWGGGGGKEEMYCMSTKAMWKGQVQGQVTKSYKKWSHKHAMQPVFFWYFVIMVRFF